MNKLYFATYADQNYLHQQLALNELANSTGQFDGLLAYSKHIVQKSRWYQKNHELFEERGLGEDGRVKPGFFVWKPWIIFHALENCMQEGDVLMYIDCGDTITEHETLREFLLEKMQNLDVLLTDGAFPNYKYCRRDTFVGMGCDTPEYHNAIQVEAGIIVVKKTVRTMELISEWLKLCQDRVLISNDENKLGLPNLEGFVFHRWDQSILSLCKIRRGIFSDNSMRKYVLCNIND